jgi:signal transduction histidine kinase/ligand-binding sensor domain-containing protein
VRNAQEEKHGSLRRILRLLSASFRSPVWSNPFRATRKSSVLRITVFAVAFVGLVAALLSSFPFQLFPTHALPLAPADVPAPSGLNLHQWGAVTLFHGLPSDHVQAIAQDLEGVMWFGTDGGLAKYDGRRTQKVGGEDLPAGRVRALACDAKGGLWIGTESGAALLVGEHFDTISETVGYPVTRIVQPEPGRSILATERGTLFACSYAPDGRRQISAVGPHDSPLLNINSTSNTPLPITSIAVLKDELVVGTRSRGLLAVSGKEVKEVPSRPRAFFVRAMAVDGRGKLWIGTETSRDDSGLFDCGELLRPQKVGTETGTVTALSFDARGDLWAGTDGRGVFHFRGSHEVEHFTFESTAGGLRSDKIYSAFVDREGVIWFGTDRGVCRYDPHSPRAERVSDKPEGNFAWTLFQSSDGSLWCGSNKGLFVRGGDSRAGGVSDQSEGTGWLPVNELSGKTIHSIAETASGLLIVGSTSGFYGGSADSGLPGKRRFARLDRGPASAATPENVRATCRFRGATYVASYGIGLRRLEDLPTQSAETARFTTIWPGDAADQRAHVISLYSEGQDRLWIGTAEAGIFVFDGKEVKTETALESLAGNAVRSIAGDMKNGLWIATARGLYRYSSDKLAPILEGTDARSVASAGPNRPVWCATSGGLYTIWIDESDHALFARLDTERGLPSDSVFTVLPTHPSSESEALWIGTNRGLAYYEPGAAPPLLRVIRILGKRAYQPEELKAGLTLEYPQNSLVLEVAAVSSRTFPEQFQYSATLSDDMGKIVKRSTSQDSQFVMENLRPGSYRGEIRAYTNDLVPSETLTFNFNIAKAPFPKTSAALSVLLLLALVALSWGYYENRKLGRANDALAAANRQLAQTRLQLANETENERRRIARDLHDQTLSDLRRLLLLTDRLPRAGDGYGGDAIDPTVLRNEIESVSTEIRHICEDLSPSALANVGLMASLEWALSDAVAHLPPDRKFEYEFECSDELEERLKLDSGSSIQIYRIVQEAVSNACRHAGATHVRLSARIDDTPGGTSTASTLGIPSSSDRVAGVLVVSLEDDGRGFDADARGKRQGRGLSNIRSRASIIEAEVSWQKGPGGGTVFTLRKPLSVQVP